MKAFVLSKRIQLSLFTTFLLRRNQEIDNFLNNGNLVRSYRCIHQSAINTNQGIDEASTSRVR